MENDSKPKSIQVPEGVIENLKIIIGGLLLLIFFFLPWLEIQLILPKSINYSGWDLPKVESNLNEFFGIEHNSKFGNLYFLYLLPIIAISLIYLAYLDFRKYFSYLEILCGIITVVVLYRIFIEIEVKFRFIGIGLIGTSIVSILLTIDGFKRLPKIKAPSIEKNNTNEASNFSLSNIMITILLVVFIFCLLLAIFSKVF